MPSTGIYRPAPDAEQTIEGLAAPQLASTASAIAAAIPQAVPVHHGAARRTYRTAAAPPEQESGHAVAKVWIKSPFWHFLEYGTRFNAPYRPAQRAVEGLGLRYEAH